MLKKTVCFALCVFALLSLCGCNLFTADTAELLAAPALSGDMLPIADAVKASVKEEYSFKYPSRGDYRSAIIQQDINKDGTLEAFAFYSTADKETTTMHINAVVFENGEWRSAAQQKITAGGIDRVYFSDLDGDGTEEILTGWEIYGSSELQLAVYSLGQNTLTQRMLQKYTHFVPCDLDDDGKNEVFLIKSAPTESLNTASVYSLTDVGVEEISSCELDSTAKTINEPKVAALSTGVPAIYIDEIKGAGAVTEVIFFEKGQLVNPLLSTDTKETLKTLRSASFEAADINGDGIPEIPVQSDVPSVTKTGVNEKLYLTNWCSYNGETLTAQLTALSNLNDGYYYGIPKKWIGKIAVLKDAENSLMEIYRYDNESMTATERLMYFKAVKKTDWDSGKYKNEDIKEIVNDGKTVYACNISKSASDSGVDLEKVKADFILY